MSPEDPENSREMKKRALDDVEHNAPHTRDVQDWLDARLWPGPPLRRSAEEIANGRQQLYERLAVKALKREAEKHRPPPPPPPRPADYYEQRHRERKEHIARRKASRDALQKLRDNPLKGPKLPPPLPTPSPAELKRRAVEKRDSLERIRVRDARVSHFEALSAKRKWDRRVKDAASILSDIILLLDVSSMVAVVGTSRHCATISRPLLFRFVEVHHSKAPKFFATIAANPQFGEWVRRLDLQGLKALRPLYGPDFEATAKNLVNLHTLHIECDIDVRGFATSFRGVLKQFSYYPLVNEDVVEFLTGQRNIESIYCRDYNLRWCAPTFLPCLKSIRGHPEDLPLLVASRPVQEVHMVYDRDDYDERPVVPLEFLASSAVRVQLLSIHVSQLVTVAENPMALRTLLPWVQQLVVMQDRTWGGHQSPALDFSDHIRKMVECVSHVPSLRHLVIMTMFQAEQAHLI
ncbi:hypothetical protein B0H14DRAFT_2577632 [Mycena olivaceomarginata]|nr:hypothetical protein B0H14DRAFT_2577632 [Mycena olivaceomarginata]